MENQNVKRGRGRPKKYSTEEERIKNKTTYMLNRPWYCEICKTGRNYTLPGKHCHLNTIKHRLNNEINDMKKIIDKTHSHNE